MKYFKNASSRVHLATQTFQKKCQRDSHRPDRKESFSVSVQNQINTKLWWELQLNDMTLGSTIHSCSGLEGLGHKNWTPFRPMFAFRGEGEGTTIQNRLKGFTTSIQVINLKVEINLTKKYSPEPVPRSTDDKSRKKWVNKYFKTSTWISLETPVKMHTFRKKKKEEKRKTIFFAYEDPISLGQKWVNYQTRSRVIYLSWGGGGEMSWPGSALQRCGHVVSNRHDRTLIDLLPAQQASVIGKCEFSFLFQSLEISLMGRFSSLSVCLL